MRPVRAWIWVLATVFTFPAVAQTNGDEVIGLLDKAMTQAKDHFYEYACITKEPGKKEESMKFKVHAKGTEWRRIELLSPGDVKGTRILIRSLSQIYVYIPSMKKIRRVASHVRDRGFMSTTMNFDEMALVTYGDMFSGKLLKESDTHWTVEANLRPGKNYMYPRLEIDILKDKHHATEIRYFNAKGVKLKTEKRIDWTCKKATCSPMNIVMIDHVKSNKSTTLTREKWKENTGVKDSYFTVRSLQRGT